MNQFHGESIEYGIDLIDRGKAADKVHVILIKFKSLLYSRSSMPCESVEY